MKLDAVKIIQLIIYIDALMQYKIRINLNNDLYRSVKKMALTFFFKSFQCREIYTVDKPTSSKSKAFHLPTLPYKAINALQPT